MEKKLRMEYLSMATVSEIYNKDMKEDFPPTELKPLSMILDLMERGKYVCLGMYEDEKLAAYAYMCRTGNGGCVLLDYYAVCKGLRSKGYGSVFLKMLQEECKDYDGILFEVESGLTAETQDEMQTVKRRISFYLKNGVRETSISTLQFGVDLTLFYLPVILEYEDHTLLEKVEFLYQILFPERIRQERVSLRIRQ